MKKLLYCFTLACLPLFGMAQFEKTDDETSALIDDLYKIGVESLEDGTYTEESFASSAEQYAQRYRELIADWKGLETSNNTTTFLQFSLYRRAAATAAYQYFLYEAYQNGFDTYEEFFNMSEKMRQYTEQLEKTSFPSTLSFSAEGKNYTQTNLSKYADDVRADYYATMATYYYMAKENESAAGYARKLYGVSTWAGIESDELLIAADALYKGEDKVSDAYFDLFVAGFEKAYKIYAKDPVEPDSILLKNLEFAINRIDYHAYGTGSDLDDITDKMNLATRISRTTFYYDEYTQSKDYAKLALEFGNGSYEFVRFVLDTLEPKAYEGEIVNLALKKVIESDYKYTDSELERYKTLASRYGYSDTEASIKEILDNRIAAQKKAERKEKALATRRKINILIGVEPLGFIYGQANFALDFRIGRVVQEFRYAHIYAGKNKWRFGQAFSDNDGLDKTPYRFTGFEASYAFKYLIYLDGKPLKFKGGRPSGAAAYAGPEFRFSTYNFDSTNTTAMNPDGSVIAYNQGLNPVSQRFEGALKVGVLAMHRWVAADFWVGIGAGYRNLQVEGYDTRVTDFSDPHFDMDRWNKAYFVYRFGFRLSFMIL